MAALEISGANKYTYDGVNITSSRGFVVESNTPELIKLRSPAGVAFGGGSFVSIGGGGNIVSQSIIGSSIAGTVMINGRTLVQDGVVTEAGRAAGAGNSIQEDVETAKSIVAAGPIAEIDMSGATELTGDFPAVTDVGCSGSTKIRAGCPAVRNVRCSGAASASLKPGKEEIEARCSGSATLNLNDAQVNMVRLDASGAARICGVRAMIKAVIGASGAASISYTHDPKCHPRERASGAASISNGAGR